MDFLDVLNPAPDYYLTGYYYPSYPDTTSTARRTDRKTFHYRQINPYSKAFAIVMNGVQLNQEVYAIKTHDDIEFKTKGYISTQNGAMWIIDEIVYDEQVVGAEEALRLFKRPVQTEYLIRLVRVENPWEIGTP